MLDCECYERMKEAIEKAVDEEVTKTYFKNTAKISLRTLKSFIEKEHAYAAYWNDFEEWAINRDVVVWRLANSHIDFYEKIFNDFEEYVKEQLEKDILRRKLNEKHCCSSKGRKEMGI